MAEIWSELLGVAEIGRDDDFFSLGGHSLLATQVTSRLRSGLGVELSLRVLFEDPTLRGLARKIDELRDWSLRCGAAGTVGAAAQRSGDNSGGPGRSVAAVLRPGAPVVPAAARPQEPRL